MLKPNLPSIDPQFNKNRGQRAPSEDGSLSARSLSEYAGTHSVRALCARPVLATSTGIEGGGFP